MKTSSPSFYVMRTHQQFLHPMLMCFYKMSLRFSTILLSGHIATIVQTISHDLISDETVVRPGWSPRPKTGIGQTDHTQNRHWPDRQYPKIGIGQTEQTLATIGQTEQNLDTIGQTDQTLSRPLGRPNRP